VGIGACNEPEASASHWNCNEKEGLKCNVNLTSACQEGIGWNTPPVSCRISNLTCPAVHRKGRNDANCADCSELYSKNRP
jgi:hypothetical protein